MKKEKNTGFLRVAKDCAFSLDDRSSGCNNNGLFVGCSGTGKTLKIAYPFLYEPSGSIIMVDPKGRAYEDCAAHLESLGYKVHLIDFTDPMRSEGYNPMDYIRSTQDIMKLASMITYSAKPENVKCDPFWDQQELILSCAVIGYIYETLKLPMNFKSMLILNAEGERDGEEDKESKLRKRFELLRKMNPDSWACQKFEQVDTAPYKTYDTIRSTLSAKLSSLDTPELCNMMARGDFSFTDIADRKTAVFVTVSDTDRSMDLLANIFFTQAMNELCEYADKKCKGRLPIPVRFILDDFATNCTIADFPKMISSIRSRGISAMIMIQAESQLEQIYGRDACTIIANCDTYVYLGSNDLETAKSISVRCDRELGDILYMPHGECWVFRSGNRPIHSQLIDPSRIIDDMRRKSKLKENNLL